MTSFEDFMNVRKAASDAYVCGDGSALAAISPSQEPSSLFPPSGTCVVGVEVVDSFNRAGVANCAEGSTNEFEIDHMGSSGDLGYWTGRQRSVVRFKANHEPVPMTLRVTEVFSKASGDWLMIHRHADPLKD